VSSCAIHGHSWATVARLEIQILGVARKIIFRQLLSWWCVTTYVCMHACSSILLLHIKMSTLDKQILKRNCHFRVIKFVEQILFWYRFVNTGHHFTWWPKYCFKNILINTENIKKGCDKSCSCYEEKCVMYTTAFFTHIPFEIMIIKY
jgi:hypothetical protein